MLHKEITLNNRDLIIWEDGTIIQKEFMRADGKKQPRQILTPRKEKGLRGGPLWRVRVNRKYYDIARLLVKIFDLIPKELEKKDWTIEPNEEPHTVANIRINSINYAARKRVVKNSTGYYGVSKTSSGRYQAHLSQSTKGETVSIHLGIFDSPKEAGEAVLNYLQDKDYPEIKKQFNATPAL